jgi:phosphate transport system substrate-binding protein
VAALAVLGVVGALALTTGPVAGAATGPTVSGGGSSFVGLLMSQWRADAAKPPYDASVSYTSADSGFGRAKFASGELDFGMSDIPFTASELPDVQGRPFAYVPAAAAPLGITFNVIGDDGARITDLDLTAEAVCRLFTVPGIRWDDPSVVATNPGVRLPSRAVRPIVRSDRAGTSYVLSEFCLDRAPAVWDAFRSFIGTGQYFQDGDLAARVPVSQWPHGYGSVATGFAGDGVGDAVSAHADAVTYTEVRYTKVLNLPAAAVQNSSGAFVAPTNAAGTRGLAFSSWRPDGTIDLANQGPDPDAYFPSTYSYAIVPTAGFDPDKGAVLARFLDYAVCQGQARSEPLLYSRLPASMVDRALDGIAAVPGAGPRPATTDCGDLVQPPAVIPESPLTALLPVVALGSAGLGLLWVRRRRLRGPIPAA